MIQLIDEQLVLKYVGNPVAESREMVSINCQRFVSWLIFSLARYLVDIVDGYFGSCIIHSWVFSLQYLHKKCQPFRERITNRCKEVTRPTKITEGSMLRRGASKWKFCLLFVWYLSVMSSPIKRHWRPIFLVREELLARVLISRERRWEHILSHLLAGN